MLKFCSIHFTKLTMLSKMTEQILEFSHKWKKRSITKITSINLTQLKTSFLMTFLRGPQMKREKIFKGLLRPYQSIRIIASIYGAPRASSI